MAEPDAAAATKGVPAVATRALTRRFGKNAAVRGLDLEIPRGGIVALVGPNGAGKTTAIQMLLGLLRPTSGDVRVLGLDPLADRLALRLRTGYVPDHKNLYPWMTVKQVLDLARDLHPRWDPSYGRSLAGRFALPLERKVKSLSRGERAKLAFAIAASPRPELLVLDEPTSGLDPLVRHSFLEVVRELAQEGDRTILFSTHIMGDVDGIAERVVVLSEGAVLADESAATLRARFRKASLLFAEPPARPLPVPGARRVSRGLREWVAVFDAGSAPDAGELRRSTGAADVRFVEPTFDDVFLELLGPPPEASVPDVP